MSEIGRKIAESQKGANLDAKVDLSSESLSATKTSKITSDLKQLSKEPFHFRQTHYQNLTQVEHDPMRYASRFVPSSSGSETELTDLQIIKLQLFEALDAQESRPTSASLLALAESYITLSMTLGHLDEAGEMLEHVAYRYDQLGEADQAIYNLARAQFLHGDLAEALTTLQGLAPNSLLAEPTSKFAWQISALFDQQTRLQRVRPQLMALEQMRMRVVEQLKFEQSEIKKTWWKSQNSVDADRAYYDHLIDQANAGIQALAQGLVSGKVSTLEEAFANATFLPGFAGEGVRQSGESFRDNLLKNSHVDVDALMAFSKIQNESERERWLLEYTKSLRKNFGSLDGYPAQTIFVNLYALQDAKDMAVQNEATSLLQEVSGEQAITGLDDAVYAALLREGAKDAVPLVIAGMLAGPLGAYAESAVTGTDITLMGRTLWSGANAVGEAGYVARGAGFAVEGAVFWLGRDVGHSTMFGGEKYFTGKGLVRSYLMLGGYKLLMKAWQASLGSYLEKEAQAISTEAEKLPQSARLAKAEALSLQGMNRVGGFATEWAGFVGIGKLEQLLELAPEHDQTFRQALAEAGISLIQLKLAMTAGNVVTNNFFQKTTLEFKLNGIEQLFEKALANGKITPEIFQKAFQSILELRQDLMQWGMQDSPLNLNSLAIGTAGLQVFLHSSLAAAQEKSGTANDGGSALGYLLLMGAGSALLYKVVDALKKSAQSKETPPTDSTPPEPKSGTDSTLPEPKSGTDSTLPEPKPETQKPPQEPVKDRPELDLMDWSPEQKGQLIALIEKSAGSKQLENAFAMLGLALEALKGSGWNKDQQYQVATLITEQSGEKVGAAYLYLSSALTTMEKAGWSKDAQYQFVACVAGHAKTMIGPVFKALGLALPTVKVTVPEVEQQHQIFSKLVEKAKGDADKAFEFIQVLFGQKLTNSSPQTFEIFTGMLDGLNDYNRRSVLTLLINHRLLFEVLGTNFTDHLKLYADILKKWPRLGFSILEGVFEATARRLISIPIDEDWEAERKRIFYFIDNTRGFIPALYQVFLLTGDGLFTKLREWTQAILADQFGMPDAKRLMDSIGKGGKVFLLGVIQMASPTSGSSFVDTSRRMGLLTAVLEAGDLRNHIPEKWRNKFEIFKLTQGEWQFKQGELADPEGKLRDLVGDLKGSEDGKIAQTALVQVLTEYLKNRTVEGRETVRKTLYQLAARNHEIAETVKQIQKGDFSDLVLLEQLFGDKNSLPKFLVDALEQIPEELLQSRKKNIEGDGKAIVNKLKKVWEADLSIEKREASLGSILKVYETGDIEAKVLPKVSGDLAAMIQNVMHLTPTLGKKQIIGEILEETIQIIQGEKAKYVYQEAEQIEIGLRAVKGPTYGLAGLTSGVCTAEDLALWKKPEFKLLSITDETSQQVVGSIHVFEVEINGKKYLTLPGINPSVEFLSKVDGEKLYKPLIEKVIAFAQAGDYAGVYIPKDLNIQSNRSDIRNAIKKANYSTKSIPEVSWNTLPEPHPFSEVYVVWER